MVADRKAILDAAQAAYDNSSVPVFTTVTNTSGLKADIYNYDPSTPYPTRTNDHVFCKTITVDNINKDWGGGDIEGCGSDFVMIHYTGFITVPTSDNYTFLAQADDGWYMTIGDTVVNDNWVLKGCGGWWSQPITLEASKSYPIDAWFYEYGGGACNQLIYQNSQTWDIVPASWFSQDSATIITDYIKDASLLKPIEVAQQDFANVTDIQTQLQNNLNQINQTLTADLASQTQNASTIDTAQQNVTTSEQELNVSKQELAAIPPFKDTTLTPTPPTQPTQEPTPNVTQSTPEPVPTTTPEPNQPQLPVDITTVDPSTLSDTQVAELISTANTILDNSQQGSPEYNQALSALFVAAQADDIKVDPQLASVPVLGNVAVGLTNAINFMGNVGSDMSPKVRAQSKKIVVTAVVAVGTAVNAATGAALMATPTGGASVIRRKQ